MPADSDTSRQSCGTTQRLANITECKSELMRNPHNPPDLRPKQVPTGETQLTYTLTILTSLCPRAEMTISGMPDHYFRYIGSLMIFSGFSDHYLRDTRSLFTGLPITIYGTPDHYFQDIRSLFTGHAITIDRTPDRYFQDTRSLFGGHPITISGTSDHYFRDTRSLFPGHPITIDAPRIAICHCRITFAENNDSLYYHSFITKIILNMHPSGCPAPAT